MRSVGHHGERVAVCQGNSQLLDFHPRNTYYQTSSYNQRTEKNADSTSEMQPETHGIKASAQEENVVEA